VSRFRWRLGAIVAVSAALGIVLTLWTKGDDAALLDEGDAFWYGTVAATTADGHWFVDAFSGGPTAAHPPLTVLALLLTSPISTSVLTQRLTMAIIGALGVGAVGLLGREVGGDRVGLAAAGLAVVVPSFWINQSLVMSEALALPLYALALAGGVRLARRPSVAVAAGTGAIIGLAALTRAEAALLLPLLVAPVVLLHRDRGIADRMRILVVAGLAAALLVAPWSLWNSTRFEDPVLISTNDGVTIAGSNCPTTYETEWIGSWSFDCVVDQPASGVDESVTSSQLRRTGLRYASENLDRVPFVVAARVARPFGLWAPGQMVEDAVGEGRPPPASWAALVAFWLSVPAALWGAVELRRRRATLWPYAAAVATVVISAGLFNGYHRHRLPVDVAVTVLVAVAAVAALDRRRGTRGGSS
jgi:hypothetical protein